MNTPQSPAQANPAPPLIPQAPAPPPGDDLRDKVPVNGLGDTVQALLREPRRMTFSLGQGGANRLAVLLLLIAAACCLIYGVVTGTFSGGDQLWAAPVKITAGLILSGLICLPSLYIFSCLGGSPASLRKVTGLLAGLLALTGVLLIGFAPVSWVFSQSTQSVAVMGGLHLLFGLLAVGFGLRFMHGAFAGEVQGSTAGIRLWTVIFVLVCLQMTTALRPIVGQGDSFLPAEKKFFINHWQDCLKTTQHTRSARPRGVDSSQARE
jgi:hypothetical protein